MSKSIEQRSHDDEPTQERLDTLLSTCEEIVQRHVGELSCPIFDLSDEEQQALFDHVHKYLQFELDQSRLRGTPIFVTGSGLALFADNEGRIQGCEVIEPTDVICGQLDDMWAYAVPTIQSVVDRDDEGVAQPDQVASSVAVLSGCIYMSGPMPTSGYEVVQELDEYQAVLPQAYYLSFTPQSAL